MEYAKEGEIENNIKGEKSLSHNREGENEMKKEWERMQMKCRRKKGRKEVLKKQIEKNSLVRTC